MIAWTLNPKPHDLCTQFGFFLFLKPCNIHFVSIIYPKVLVSIIAMPTLLQMHQNEMQQYMKLIPSKSTLRDLVTNLDFRVSATRTKLPSLLIATPLGNPRLSMSTLISLVSGLNLMNLPVTSPSKILSRNTLTQS